LSTANLYIFDNSAIEQRRLLLQSELFREYLREHAPVFVPTPPTRILDLGCGIGHLALELHDLYPQATVVGIDRDPDALATARQHPGVDQTINFVQGDIQEALPSGPFDLVYASLLMSYLRDPARVVNMVAAALAPGGTFWVKDIDARSQEAAIQPDSKYLMTLFFEALQQMGSHPQIASELPPMLTAAGFTVSQTATDEVYPLGGNTVVGDSFLSGLIAGVRTSRKMLSRITGSTEDEILDRIDRVIAAAESSTKPLGYLHTINIVARQPAQSP
jgi:SAM-dependent methyltransferase